MRKVLILGTLLFCLPQAPVFAADTTQQSDYDRVMSGVDSIYCRRAWQAARRQPDDYNQDGQRPFSPADSQPVWQCAGRNECL